jgi:hypothetical protein
MSPPRWPITAFGETRSAYAWSRDRRCNVSYEVLRRRLHGGWDAEHAITDPPLQPGYGKKTITAIRAFGCVKSLAAWERDRRCSVTARTIGKRLERGVTAKEAIATPAYQVERRPERRRASSAAGSHGRWKRARKA